MTVSKNRQLVIFKSVPGEGYKGYASLSCFNKTGFAFIYDGREDTEDSLNLLRELTSHEFGHSFGCLYDEYQYGGVVNCGEDCPDPGPERANCDIATTEIGCPKWCNGTPKSVDELSAEICETYGSIIERQQECHAKNDEGLPCRWVMATEECINVINYCKTFTNNFDCDETGDYCVWVYSPRYFQDCIPRDISNVDIGNDCDFNLGCFKGCNAADWFRSSRRSKMYGLFHPFEKINEDAIVKRIQENLQQITVLSVKEEKPEFIAFDVFESDGKLKSGGLINLDIIMADSRLKNAVKDSMGLQEPIQKEDIDLRNVDIDVLIKLYLNSTEEDTTSYGVDDVNQNDLLDNNDISVCVSGECSSESLIKKIISWFNELF